MGSDSPLWVFHGEDRVGRIDIDDDDRMEFVYADSWLDHPDAFAVSLSLPLQADPFQDPRAHRFFANLLPEGPSRQLLARRLGLSVDNDASILRAVGGECAGALSIVEEDEPISRSSWDYLPLSSGDLAQLAHRGQPLPEGVMEGARLSLAGAQDKLPVLQNADGDLLLPLGGAPSTHILKFPNRDFAHLADNETFLTLLARRCGLPVVDIERIERGGTPMVLVRRYDRPMRDGIPVRLHQEDLCQALGLPAHRKYEADRGPTFPRLYELVRSNVANPLGDCQTVLGWAAFSSLTGNADGHAKNLSLLYEHRTPNLAPIYDLVCTHVYPRVERRLAFGIGGERDPGHIGKKQWEALADDIDVGQRFLLGVVASMAEQIEANLEPVGREFTERYGPTPMLAMTRKVVRRQLRRTKTLLA